MRRKFILVGLFMAVFAFPLFLSVDDLYAQGFGCKGNKQAVRQCLKKVIIGLEQQLADIWGARQNPPVNKEMYIELLDGKLNEKEELDNVCEVNLSGSQSIIANLSGLNTCVGLSNESKEKIQQVTDILTANKTHFEELVKEVAGGRFAFEGRIEANSNGSSYRKALY